mmetsp:Transcript_14850/g.34324  ORF Transcript_14850/g.34324 Transcript_14850/m.34324 type:complete len:129 (+) Transcript_14850:1994-2380(+)
MKKIENAVCAGSLRRKLAQDSTASRITTRTKIDTNRKKPAPQTSVLSVWFEQGLGEQEVKAKQDFEIHLRQRTFEFGSLLCRLFGGGSSGADLTVDEDRVTRLRASDPPWKQAVPRRTLSATMGNGYS